MWCLAKAALMCGVDTRLCRVDPRWDVDVSEAWQHMPDCCVWSGSGCCYRISQAKVPIAKKCENHQASSALRKSTLGTIDNVWRHVVCRVLQGALHARKRRGRCPRNHILKDK